MTLMGSYALLSYPIRRTLHGTETLSTTRRLEENASRDTYSPRF